MKERILKLWVAFESKGVQMIDRLKPETKLMAVGVAFLFMAFISIYSIASCIYYIGLKDGEQLQIKYMERSPLRMKQADSVNFKTEQRDGKQ